MRPHDGGYVVTDGETRIWTATDVMYIRMDKRFLVTQVSYVQDGDMVTRGDARVIGYTVRFDDESVMEWIAERDSAVITAARAVEVRRTAEDLAETRRLRIEKLESELATAGRALVAAERRREEEVAALVDRLKVEVNNAKEAWDAADVHSTRAADLEAIEEYVFGGPHGRKVRTDDDAYAAITKIDERRARWKRRALDAEEKAKEVECRRSHVPTLSPADFFRDWCRVFEEAGMTDLVKLMERLATDVEKLAALEKGE
jgi:hypothetical protein